MLDTKVLAAVLVSLAGATIVVNGGATNPMEEGLNFGSFEDVEMSPRSLGAFTGLVERPEPDTDVQADLNFNGSLPQEVELRSATVKPDNFTSVKLGKNRISSESSMSLYGFKGTVTLNDVTRIDGEASGVVSNGVNVSGSVEIDEKIATNRIDIRDIKSSTLKMNKVEGTVRSGASSTDISGGELSLTSFKGNMSFELENTRMNLSGEVARMEAGSFSLG